jgi:hypothetical protein
MPGFNSWRRGNFTLLTAASLYLYLNISVWTSACSLVSESNLRYPLVLEWDLISPGHISKTHVPLDLRVKFDVTPCFRMKLEVSFRLRAKLDMHLGLWVKLQWRINVYFKLSVVVHYNHVKIQTLLRLNVILFIPCTEKVAQKKVVEEFLYCISTCFTMNDIYIMYVHQVATCTICAFILAYSPVQNGWCRKICA